MLENQKLSISRCRLYLFRLYQISRLSVKENILIQYLNDFIQDLYQKRKNKRIYLNCAVCRGITANYRKNQIQEGAKLFI
jgi:hypothetical protein